MCYRDKWLRTYYIVEQYSDSEDFIAIKKYNLIFNDYLVGYYMYLQ